MKAEKSFLDEKGCSTTSPTNGPLPTPQKFATEIKKSVKGQDVFVGSIVEEILFSLKRVQNYLGGISPLQLPKNSPSLVLAPTGQGKSHTISAALNAFNIKSIWIDCAGLTGSGWRGTSLGSELARVSNVMDSNKNKPLAVVLDEFDKLAVVAHKDISSSFFGQNDFLKFFDGGIYKGHCENAKRDYAIDTNLLIIFFIGAFTGIEEIVKKRLLTGVSTVGFGASSDRHLSVVNGSVEDLRKQVKHEDVIEYGIKRELVGRLGKILTLSPLDDAAFTSIVTEGPYSIQKRMNMNLPFEVDFQISDAAVKHLVQSAREKELGARSLEPAVFRFVSKAFTRCLEDSSINVVMLDVKDGELGLRYLRLPTKSVPRGVELISLYEMCQDRQEKDSLDSEAEMWELKF